LVFVRISSEFVSTEARVVGHPWCRNRSCVSRKNSWLCWWCFLQTVLSLTLVVQVVFSWNWNSVTHFCDTSVQNVGGVVKEVAVAWLKVPLRFDSPLWQSVKRRRRGRGSSLQVSLSKKDEFQF